ncbi:MAG: hypothetical protein ABIE22_04040 [archaeon]
MESPIYVVSVPGNLVRKKIIRDLHDPRPEPVQNVNYVIKKERAARTMFLGPYEVSYITKSEVMERLITEDLLEKKDLGREKVRKATSKEIKFFQWRIERAKECVEEKS